VKLKELIKTKDYNGIPKIRDKIEVVYHSDYWDGIICGVVRIKGEILWLEMIEENEELNSWYRKFAVLRLSKSQIKTEFAVHRDFQKYVGTNCDSIFLKPPPKLENGKNDLFYTKHSEYIKSRDFGENEIVGWTIN